MFHRTPHAKRSLGVSVLCAVITVTLAPAEQSPATAPAPAMTVRSAAFAAGSAIPKVYTCDGRGISPPLSWSGVPASARSLALIVDDPDAPDPKAPQTTWVHWVLYDIPPSASGLPEGVAATALPHGTRAGTNDFKTAAYGGPCPPVGTHRYFFKLYALDTVLPDLHQPTKAQLEAVMRSHIIARGQLIGRYARTK
ncbi:MAG TPA: YbhB/YbcL family Raf kinase inhibitor-like protein [Gemmatimonadaceae bacterium]|nr:YbhB/YbcL family Raf kinase inhibitor-like protein [Gemmatimonadaceae bacterium]